MAALRSGLGLLTAHLPACGLNIMQTALPEAMVSCDNAEEMVISVNHSALFDAAAIGPGLGVSPMTARALYDFLINFAKPVVLDADAINILALNKNWFSALRNNMVITPHPKEFDRLAGNSENGFERFKKQMEFAEKHKCIVALKGAFTSVATPDGRVMFNSVGNPGMATAGSGDVLTGIILSLLAQGYSAENAAIAGVFLHGLAGDIAAEKNCYESLIASDIINNIASAYNMIWQEKYESI
jgi:NAD(P)H-hydrate epimerase